MSDEPLELFRQWFGEAIAAGVNEANGVCLCTNHPDDGPDGRIVLLKGYSHSGFLFFSNFGSAKGCQLAADPRGCMVFWWQPLRRQVRVRGTVERLLPQESQEYFSSRPRDSQLGAWASAQSRPIGSRAELEARLAEVSARFPAEQGEVPLPEHWGGYRLMHQEVEFWQGRDSRLHDRFVYQRAGEAGWTVQRLMP